MADINDYLDGLDIKFSEQEKQLADIFAESWEYCRSHVCKDCEYMPMDAVLTAAETEIGYLDNAVQAANAAGLSEYFSDIPAEESALGAAKAFQKQAASDLNLVNTVMQYKAGSAYVNAVNAIYRDTAENRQGALDIMGKGAAKAVSGQMSLQEATRKTIRELAQKGIPAFVDKRGREWSPEAYVMMDMRSTLGNTARAAQNARCDEYKNLSSQEKYGIIKEL